MEMADTLVSTAISSDKIAAKVLLDRLDRCLHRQDRRVVRVHCHWQGSFGSPQWRRIPLAWTATPKQNSAKTSNIQLADEATCKTAFDGLTLS